MPFVGTLLGLAGLIPFVATAVGLWFTDEPFLLQVGLLYGAVIASFLGGIHWGLALHAEGGARGQLTFAVMPALIGWGAVMTGPMAGALALAVTFVAVWGYEQNAAIRRRLPPWFRRLRLGLTLVVVSCHVAYAIWIAGHQEVLWF